MEQRLQKNLNDLTNFNHERKLWLMLSFFVVASIAGIIFGWNIIYQNKLEWALGSLGCVVSVGWWYWTMRVIRHLIRHKSEEYQILSDIIIEIRSIKTNEEYTISISGLGVIPEYKLCRHCLNLKGDNNGKILLNKNLR